MTQKDFKILVSFATSIFRKNAPRKTGNLQDNAIKYEYISMHFLGDIVTGKNGKKRKVGGTKVAKIYIEDEIAPYVYYTNEPWISPRWHGKKNPNEGWVEKGVMNVCKEIAREYGGRVIEDD